MYKKSKTPEIIIDEYDSAAMNYKDNHVNYRICKSKRMLSSIMKFIAEQSDTFNSIFSQLLNFDQQDDPNNMSSTIKNQVSQNIPKTLEKQRNQILKGKKERSNIPDNVKLIHPAHENFNLVFNIMLGIKKAIDSTLDIPLYEPTEKDLMIKCKYELAPFRTSNKDNIKACTFYDYAP